MHGTANVSETENPTALGQLDVFLSPLAMRMSGAVHNNTPGAVANVAAAPERLGGALRVSWDAADLADGYRVRWKTGSQAFSDQRQELVSGGDVTSLVIRGLTPGAVYTVRVVATRDGAADGSASEAVSARVLEQPVPSGVEVVAGSGELVVSWDPTPGAAGYKLQWKSGSETFDDAATDSRQQVVSGGATTSATVVGLTDGTEYTVRVIATGASGNDGPPSGEATGTPAPDYHLVGNIGQLRSVRTIAARENWGQVFRSGTTGPVWDGWPADPVNDYRSKAGYHRVTAVGLYIPVGSDPGEVAVRLMGSSQNHRLNSPFNGESFIVENRNKLIVQARTDVELTAPSLLVPGQVNYFTVPQQVINSIHYEGLPLYPDVLYFVTVKFKNEAELGFTWSYREDPGRINGHLNIAPDVASHSRAIVELTPTWYDFEHKSGYWLHAVRVARGAGGCGASCSGGRAFSAGGAHGCDPGAAVLG